MSFTFNLKTQTLVYNHLIVLIFFFILNLYHFYISKEEHYTSSAPVETPLDIAYYTMTTHSTVGSGDIVPKSQRMKFITMIHQLLTVMLTIQLVYCFTCN
jgi:hypothetical protein